MRTNAKRLVKQVLLAALVLAPMGASAADADLLVELSGLTDRFLFARTDPNPGQITIGQTKQFFIDITNNGPSTAVGIEIQKPTLDSHIDHISTVDGCVLKSFTCTANDTSSKCKTPIGGVKVGESVIDPNDPRSWPCTIANLTDAPGPNPDAPTNFAEVTVDVSWPLPETIPTQCPAGTITLTPTSVTVTMASSTAVPGATVDPNTSNNTATNTPTAGAAAFLTIGLASSTASGGPGTQFTVEGTVKNLGPCDAVDVRARDADGSSDGKMTFVEGQTTGCNDIPATATAAAIAGPNVNPVTKGCRFGTMAPNTTKTFTAAYVVGDMLSDEMQRATTVSLNTYSTGFTYESTSASAPAGRTFDPDESDNVASVNVISKQSVSSCATAGIPGVLGLLLAAMPLVRRRRNR